VQALQRPVATLAWNGYRHMELYYAVSGSGAVLHTINPRLHPDQIVYIADHAEDQVLFFDLTFLPLVEAVAGRVKTVRHFVADDRPRPPAGRGGHRRSPACCATRTCWPPRTTTTTGPASTRTAPAVRCATPAAPPATPRACCTATARPLLHAYAGALPDALNCSARDSILPVVPMFHVNAWGLPYVACMVGAKLVFPAPALDGKSLYELFEAKA
jgi:acyl-CoA synthetase (AMP-forming)/AMP-acid ligase II